MYLKRQVSYMYVYMSIVIVLMAGGVGMVDMPKCCLLLG